MATLGIAQPLIRGVAGCASTRNKSESGLAPHDLAAHSGELCRPKGGELEQIQFLLGRESILTTERYLGSEQDLKNAVNEALVFE
jgi:hypothetical protein